MQCFGRILSSDSFWSHSIPPKLTLSDQESDDTNLLLVSSISNTSKMAEDLVKEIISQSRSMGYVKSALAFKFEQGGGVPSNYDNEAFFKGLPRHNPG